MGSHTAGHVLSDALRRAAKAHGRRAATVDGERRRTYAQLDERARRLAGALRDAGVRRGDRVATLMANGDRYLECYFGVPGSGAVLVPLNERLAVPELAYILADAEVALLIADERNAELAQQLAGEVATTIAAPDDYDARLAAAAAPAWDDWAVDEDELAALFYTGGTTGVAKGVMLTQRNLMTAALNAVLGLGWTREDTYLHSAPMFHLADGVASYAITMLGARHAFLPGFDPAATFEIIERERVTVATWVPAMLAALLVHPDRATRDLSSLRLAVHGAAPISPDLLRSCIEAFGCSFAQGYGMTEAPSGITILTNEERLLDDERLRSAGREVATVEVTVRRPDGSLCDPGEIGEVVVRGPNVMLGYLNKPEATAEVLRDGRYWTGDLATMDEDGYLFIVDRAKDMIISGGENVYSAEVENAICEHPAVLEAAVIGVPHERWGEAVHAVVVLRPGETLAEDALRDFCRERIGGFKAPASIELAAALPRSGAGKVLKRELREPHWQGRSRRVA